MVARSVEAVGSLECSMRAAAVVRLFLVQGARRSRQAAKIVQPVPKSLGGRAVPGGCAHTSAWCTLLRGKVLMRLVATAIRTEPASLLKSSAKAFVASQRCIRGSICGCITFFVVWYGFPQASRRFMNRTKPALLHHDVHCLRVAAGSQSLLQPSQVPVYHLPKKKRCTS